MNKKLIFMDLDGTIIDHSQDWIPPSTKRAIRRLKENGHTVVIATGRPPCLFYGIEETLDIHTYIAANGRYVVHDGTVLLNDGIDRDLVKNFVETMDAEGLEIGFETETDYVVHRIRTNLPQKFSDHFHLESPQEDANAYQEKTILQMILFTEEHDLVPLSERFPELSFNVSCPYGIDVNQSGGMKEVGMRILKRHLGVKHEDTIAIGDGHNDIGMIQEAHVGIAMGNACDELKAVADDVTDDCHKDGIEKAFIKLGLID